MACICSEPPLHSNFVPNAVTLAAEYQAIEPNAVLEALIGVVRPAGDLTTLGLYVPSDPGAPDSAAST